MNMRGASATSNVRWVGASQLGRAGVQLVSVLIFSHLLSPSDFGLFAMAIVVGNFVALFRDLGTSAAVIQRQKITREMLDTVFLLSLASGLCVYLLVVVASPLIARAFGNPALRDILLVIAVAFAIASIGAPQLALLERDSQFRKVAWIEVSSEVMGFLAALTTALLGAGVYSLVFQLLVSTLCSTAQLWLASSWRPKLRWNPHEFRELWRFSGNLVAFNILNYFVRNSDSILIGRFLDSASLGWYSMANRILMFPLQNVTWVIGRALLPIYSRRQDGPDEIASYYLKTLALIAAVTAPLMLGIWALRTPLIAVTLGPTWSPVADLLAWLAPIGIFQSLNSTSGTILMARGRTGVLRALGVVNTLTFVGAFVIGLHFGLIGLARAYLLATAALTTINLQIVLGGMGSNLIALGQRVGIPIACAVVAAAAVELLNAAAPRYFSDIMLLIVLIPLGASLYVALLFVFSSSLARELRAALFRWKMAP